LEIYLTEEIFSRLLISLSKELRNYYGRDLPVLIGVGISGIEIVGRLPEFLEVFETYVCDVERKEDDAIKEVINFPAEKIKGKRVLIAYVRVDTGKTLETLSKLALQSGAVDVKTLSIAVRRGASCFPHFFSFFIKDEDNLYLLLEGYPPDIPLPYPPVIASPGALLRDLNYEDSSREWFKCGDERIDKFGPGEYLYYTKLSKKCKVFVLDDGRNILGILHFSTKTNHAWIDTLAISKDAQGQGFGSKLVAFLIDWCKFNSIRWIYLDAFHGRESFYKQLHFSKIKEFVIPSYGRFCRMGRRSY